MSSAVYFLLGALVLAALGSLLVWGLQHRPSRRVEPDFADQLRALTPPGQERPATQPSGVVRLDPPTEPTGDGPA